ncbi:MAG: dTDP-4-dehydrorhamnose 3,5-epimerase [Bacteroidota bacterium]
MKLTKTPFAGLIVLEPSVINDDRGFFMESYNRNQLQKLGIVNTFVQDNHSRSQKGVIRGLHFQNPPYQQSKLIRSISGEILDVVVDIRKNSPTYGEHFSLLLSADNKKQLFVPSGFAHGFVALSDNAEILYKCDQFYHKDSEGGLLYNDPDLNINWQLDLSTSIISEKDKTHPAFKDFQSQF